MITGMIISIFVAQFMMVGIDIFSSEEINNLEKKPTEVEHASSRQGAISSPCESFSSDGIGGPTWQDGSTSNIGDIVEWPENSGHFYVAITDNVIVDPSNSADSWDGPCTCADIATGGGVQLWNNTSSYVPWQIVEWDNTYWIAQDAGSPAGEDPSAGQDFWQPCDLMDSGPCSTFYGNGGAVWDPSISVSTNDVFEYPVSSGEYYQIIIQGYVNQTVGAPGVDLDVWSSISCSCADIWLDSGMGVWDSAIVYSTGSVVEWPITTGDIWIAIAPSVTSGIEPSYAWADGSEWILCSSTNVTTGPCDGFNGMTGPVWDSNLVVSTGDVFEHPANSGVFYQMWQPNQTGLIVDISPGEPNYQKYWSEPCTCKEIWQSAGQPVWDSSITYTGINPIVQWPSGSNDLWFINELGGVASSIGEPGIDVHWKLCENKDNESFIAGGPCAGFDIMGLEVQGVWEVNTPVSFGDIYEYPANSGLFYEIVIASMSNQIAGQPGLDLDAWAIKECPCEETWGANGEPVWDVTAASYPGNFVVEWPAGSMSLWISEGGGLQVNVEPNTDPHWVPCNKESEPNGGPCAGLNSLGVWNPDTNVTFGEIYEYPTNSGIYYEIVIASMSNQIVGEPGVDLDAWGLKECPCEETWNANGMPIWNSTNNGYLGNYVVEWPAGSGLLYISEGGGLTNGTGEPGVDSHWIPCKKPEAVNQGGPCAGLDIVSEWNSSINVSSGEVYEYPSNSGIFYQVVIQGYTNEYVSSPDIDLDVWALIACPCKETWDANGMPVWNNSNNGYAGNYVVEWPAGSGMLYISEGGGLTTGAGEPGIDGHWIPCKDNSAMEDDTDKVESDEDSSIPSIGLFGTIVAVSIGLVITSRKQEVA